jgi:hypothetical protein
MIQTRVVRLGRSEQTADLDGFGLAEGRASFLCASDEGESILKAGVR